jgi:hypothetical protein
VAIVQASGPHYRDVLARALGYPATDDQDGDALKVSSGELAIFSAAVDGTGPHSGPLVNARPGPVPPVHGPPSREADPGLLISAPHCGASSRSAGTPSSMKTIASRGGCSFQYSPTNEQRPQRQTRADSEMPRQLQVPRSSSSAQTTGDSHLRRLPCIAADQARSERLQQSHFAAVCRALGPRRLVPVPALAPASDRDAGHERLEQFGGLGRSCCLSIGTQAGPRSGPEGGRLHGPARGFGVRGMRLAARRARPARPGQRRQAVPSRQPAGKNGGIPGALKQAGTASSGISPVRSTIKRNLCPPDAAGH